MLAVLLLEDVEKRNLLPVKFKPSEQCTQAIDRAN